MGILETVFDPAGFFKSNDSKGGKEAGPRVTRKNSELLGKAAVLRLDNAAQRRMQTEQLLTQQELYLGTPNQVAGKLPGGLNPAELPYAMRYSFNEGAASGLTAKPYKIEALRSGVNTANGLLAQAQAAAAAGDLSGAATLKEQADAAVLGEFNAQTGARKAIFRDPSIYGTLITSSIDPNVEALTRLNSPIAQTVGGNLARGRELSDPNSGARRQLQQNIVGAPVAEISAGQRAALGNISGRTSSALRDLDMGLGRALAEFTGGEVKALSELDAGFGRALQAITVGESKSVGEIDSGLQYALTSVQKATENALRAIESGAEGTRRAATDQMRQRGSAARPFETQAVQARTEERFATQRAITETERGRQEAALQAGAAGEKAGIYERSNLARAGLESDAAGQRAGIIVNAAGNRGGAELNTAQQKASLQQQAGIAEAGINLQATLAKGDLMQRGEMFIEQFSADFAFNSAQQAQAFLQNQSGIREQYQGALDNLALATAGILQQQSAQAQQFSQFLTLGQGPPAGLEFLGAALGAIGGGYATGKKEKAAQGQAAGGGGGGGGGGEPAANDAGSGGFFASFISAIG
jgi:hypothetical protein